MSDCRFGVSPVNYPDPDPEPFLIYRYSVLENVLWRISLIDGRLKDCSLVAYFDDMIYMYHHALNLQNKPIFISVFCKLFAMSLRMFRQNFGNRLRYFFFVQE